MVIALQIQFSFMGNNLLPDINQLIYEDIFNIIEQVEE